MEHSDKLQEQAKQDDKLKVLRRNITTQKRIVTTLANQLARHKKKLHNINVFELELNDPFVQTTESKLLIHTQQLNSLLSEYRTLEKPGHNLTQ